MIKKLLINVILSMRRFFRLPAFRYSTVFRELRKTFTYTSREKMLDAAMKVMSSNEVEGDYLEFGVFVGGTFIPAFHFAQIHNLKTMRFYAFDSFKGLPETKETRADGALQANTGDFTCDEETFKKNISKGGVDLHKVKIVRGWYDEVLNEETKRKLPIKKASVVYIDCDLYKSTVPVLDFITDYLCDGSVLIIDDWFSFGGNPDRGQQKAFREWLEKTPSFKATEFRKFYPLGNSFIIHRGQS